MYYFRRLLASIIYWRWGIVLLAALLGVIYLLLTESESNPGVGSIIINFPRIVVLPILAWLALSLLKIRQDFHTLSKQNTLRNQLNQSLRGCYHLNAAAGPLYQFFKEFLPITGLSLLQNDRFSVDFKVVGDNCPDKSPGKTLVESDDFPKILANLKPLSGVVLPSPVSAHYPDHANHFYLLFTDQKNEDLVLVLFFPAGEAFEPSDFSTIQDLTGPLGEAIHRIRLEEKVSKMENSLRKEQSRIARYLHDSISGDLAVIATRLDQFSEKEPRSDFKLLSDLANESNRRVRALLSELHPVSEPLELAAALYKTAREISARANFKVQFDLIGEPRKLPAHVERQLLYISREVLRNIEKHTSAAKVIFSLIWNEDDLTIECTDDGPGFEVSKTLQKPGHLGLRIIQDITRELNGNFSISSSENFGTKLTLWFPV